MSITDITFLQLHIVLKSLTRGNNNYIKNYSFKSGLTRSLVIFILSNFKRKLKLFK